MQASVPPSQTKAPPQISPAQAGCETSNSIQRTLISALEVFDRWLAANGSFSFDPYDIWGTRYGLKARRLYYEKHPLGVALVAPLLLVEIFCPSWRGMFVKRNRFATADAQRILAFLNLHRATQKEKYLVNARQLGNDMLDYSVSGYSGLCWGYPFDWQHQGGMWSKNTPFITCTPYCYEAYCALHKATGETRYLEIAASIASFVFNDLRDTPTAPNAAAASYSPHDNSQVINASAYRAWLLFDAARRFSCPDYQVKAERNLNFILQNQRPDGSWFYGAGPTGRFIDHFHTCFVLKNLFKIGLAQNRPELGAAVRNGFEHYRRELFDAEGLPRSFAIRPRTRIVRLEMYDFAEAITLGSLLRDEIPEAYERAQKLARVLCSKYQLSDGHFVTRVYVGGIRHTFPFLRWPQSQLFLALSNLLLVSGSAPTSVPEPVSTTAETA